jgi:hypothetical protein
VLPVKILLPACFGEKLISVSNTVKNRDIQKKLIKKYLQKNRGAF